VAFAADKVAQTETPSTPKQEAKEKLKDSAGAVKMAKVFFVEPKDGATVATKFTVKMGLEGMKLKKAGEDVDNILEGHHHLVVDGKPVPQGQVVPTDATHLHFGKAQTEAELTLAPGKHTLTLQFADGAHRSFGDKMSQTIHITVK